MAMTNAYLEVDIHHSLRKIIGERREVIALAEETVIVTGTLTTTSISLRIVTLSGYCYQEYAKHQHSHPVGWLRSSSTK